MINPLSYVKNVRTVYDRFYQKNIKEVQVQFLDENPAWIPYDTLLSMLQVDIKEDYTEWERFMKILFKIREFAWVIVSEIEDWLYPYRNRLTPEEQFEIRVKDPMSGENFMVEEHIQSQNERIERLQDEMITVQMKLAEHEERFKTRVKIKKGSTSVSGEIKNIFNS